jgi:hypothetical protein
MKSAMFSIFFLLLGCSVVFSWNPEDLKKMKMCIFFSGAVMGLLIATSLPDKVIKLLGRF